MNSLGTTEITHSTNGRASLAYDFPAGMTLAQLSRPQPSVPRNLLLAEPMLLSHDAEEAGSGILDMIALCSAAGLRPPAFRKDGANFVQPLWRSPANKDAGVLWQLQEVNAVVPEATEATGEAAAQFPAKVPNMLMVMDEPSTRQVIMQPLDLRHDDHFRTPYFQPALPAQLAEPRNPKYATSPNQNFHLTAKGIAERADATKPAMGLASSSNPPAGKVLKADFGTAKACFPRRRQSELRRRHTTARSLFDSERMTP